MDTNTLNKLMRKDEKTARLFKGTMARDLLPPRLEMNSMYVINLSTSTDPSGGSHWVLLHVSEKYSAFICSLGSKPVHKNVIDSLYSVNDTIVYNDFKNQGLTSTVCAWHCIFTAAMLARGHDLLDIMTQFYTNQPFINDNACVEIICTQHQIEELVPISDWNFIFGQTNQIVNQMDKNLGGNGKSPISSGSNLKNEEFQKLDEEKNSKAKSRKQEKPKKINPNRREKESSKRWPAKKAVQKMQKDVKTLQSTHPKKSTSVVSAKAQLMDQIKNSNDEDESFTILRKS